MAKLVECIPNFSVSKEKDEAVFQGLVDVANAIPGLASAQVKREASDFLLSRCTHDIESEALDGDMVHITSHGIGGHRAGKAGRRQCPR